jgi:hypothetical protein
MIHVTPRRCSALVIRCSAGQDAGGRSGPCCGRKAYSGMRIRSQADPIKLVGSVSPWQVCSDPDVGRCHSTLSHACACLSNLARLATQPVCESSVLGLGPVPPSGPVLLEHGRDVARRMTMLGTSSALCWEHGRMTMLGA